MGNHLSGKYYVYLVFFFFIFINHLKCKRIARIFFPSFLKLKSRHFAHRNTFCFINDVLCNSCLTRTRLQRYSVSLCLDIRSRNEEAINSMRNRIYSLKVFYFLLNRRRYFCGYMAGNRSRFSKH